jgi:hypothetical protein
MPQAANPLGIPVVDYADCIVFGPTPTSVSSELTIKVPWNLFRNSPPLRLGSSISPKLYQHSFFHMLSAEMTLQHNVPEYRWTSTLGSNSQAFREDLLGDHMVAPDWNHFMGRWAAKTILLPE